MKANTLDEAKTKLEPLHKYAYEVEHNSEMLQLKVFTLINKSIRDVLKLPGGLEIAQDLQKSAVEIVKELNNNIFKYKDD